ncbi:MAG: YggS family pyridoxal phosphate-dependent enzyme [Chloroflexi bacterium]|nr:YggS family pyridoxal phosphate-dependent enzyme [Chloroflexota bacterium]
MRELADNLERVRERIAAAARRVGREPESVTLIAVTKTHPIGVIREAVALGVADLGENRVEEAIPKIAAMSKGGVPRWHMIGHIQSRKAREVAAHFDTAHSVDSAQLAERLSRFAAGSGRCLPIFVECNVTGEASKNGLPADRFADDRTQADALTGEIEKMLALPGVRLRGLMAMAPVGDAPEEARPVFRQLRRLRDFLAARLPHADWSELSMGMTDDFEVAIEEGATAVRVGRAIFGERR